MTRKNDDPVRDIIGHRRVNHGLLASLERRLLSRLAPRVARRASADACTAVGAVGAALCCLGYAISNRWVWFVLPATLGVALHWLGDSLDGTVARLRGEQRPRYGFYLDHLVDVVCQAAMFVGLGLSPFVDLTVAIASLAAFQSLAVLVLLRTAVLGEFRLSFGRLGPTEVHLALILLGASILVLGPLPIGGSGLSGYDFVVTVFGLLAVFHFVRVGVREALVLRALNE